MWRPTEESLRRPPKLKRRRPRQGKPTSASKRTRTQTQDERQARGTKLRHEADEMLTDTELDTVHFMTLAEDAVRREEEDVQVLEETVQQLKDQLKIHRSVLLMYHEAGSLTGFADPPHLETFNSLAMDGQTWLIRVAKSKTLAALERGRREGRRTEPPTTPTDRTGQDDRGRRSEAGVEQGERGIRQGRTEPGDTTDRTSEDEWSRQSGAGEEQGEKRTRRGQAEPGDRTNRTNQDEQSRRTELGDTTERSNTETGTPEWIQGANRARLGPRAQPGLPAGASATDGDEYWNNGMRAFGGYESTETRSQGGDRLQSIERMLADFRDQPTAYYLSLPPPWNTPPDRPVRAQEAHKMSRAVEDFDGTALQYTVWRAGFLSMVHRCVTEIDQKIRLLFKSFTPETRIDPRVAGLRRLPPTPGTYKMILETLETEFGGDRRLLTSTMKIIQDLGQIKITDVAALRQFRMHVRAYVQHCRQAGRYHDGKQRHVRVQHAVRVPDAVCRGTIQATRH